jgi:hypothetical protein
MEADLKNEETRKTVEVSLRGRMATEHSAVSPRDERKFEALRR